VKANGAYNDTVFADVNVGPDDGRVDHRVLADEDVVADVQREKSHPFGKLLERWSNDGLFAEDAVLAHADVGQVTTDHALTHDDVLAIEDNVLRAAQNRLSADLVASMRLHIFASGKVDVVQFHFGTRPRSRFVCYA